MLRQARRASFAICKHPDVREGKRQDRPESHARVLAPPARPERRRAGESSPAPRPATECAAPREGAAASREPIERVLLQRVSRPASDRGGSETFGLSSSGKDEPRAAAQPRQEPHPCAGGAPVLRAQAPVGVRQGALSRPGQERQPRLQGAGDGQPAPGRTARASVGAPVVGPSWSTRAPKGPPARPTSPQNPPKRSTSHHAQRSRLPVRVLDQRFPNAAQQRLPRRDAPRGPASGACGRATAWAGPASLPSGSELFDPQSLSTLFGKPQVVLRLLSKPTLSRRTEGD